jgi:hypothetical protein
MKSIIFWYMTSCYPEEATAVTRNINELLPDHMVSTQKIVFFIAAVLSTSKVGSYQCLLRSYYLANTMLHM